MQCASDSNKVIKLNRVVVDGMDVSSNIIRQQISHPFDFIIPSVNVDDAHPTSVGMENPSMAENYYIFFKPMPIGSLAIEADVYIRMMCSLMTLRFQQARNVRKVYQSTLQGAIFSSL